jgi:hypothetical protein
MRTSGPLPVRPSRFRFSATLQIEPGRRVSINIADLNSRLWSAADQLRANSKLKSSEYAVPVLGLAYQILPTVFLGSSRTALCALAVFSAAPALSAQDSGTFIHRVGRDTVSIERFAWHEGRLEGDLQFRVSPWHAYQLELTEDGQVTSFAVTVRSPFAPVDYPPLQAVHLEFYADSVLEKTTRSGRTEERPRLVGPRAVPMLYPSLALLEVATRRARRSGAHEADVSFIETGTFGQRQFSVAISWVGRDSAVLNVGGTEFRLATDVDGRVLGGRVPSRNLVIDRVQARIELRAPVYAAPPDALYTAEEVRIATPGGHFAVGTLTRPINVQGPVAVAVTISGSGPQDRDGIIPSIEGYRPFREIAEALAGRGIALLRYDDRGVGGSTAGEGRTTQDLAEDVRAPVAYLRSRENIDESRIALIGHSEGGLIAPMDYIYSPFESWLQGDGRAESDSYRSDLRRSATRGRS